jgi:hypothetical protein
MSYGDLKARGGVSSGDDGGAVASPSGFRFVLVNGVPIVKDGALASGIFPWKPARAPLRQ